jgi:maleylpyruvate isomerase
MLRIFVKLYHFFRSGTSHRLRIVMNLKGLSAEVLPVDLRVDANLGPDFKAINPQGFVPVLEVGEGADHQVLIQSPAIIEWMEEAYPQNPLLPEKAFDRARVRALAAVIGCDIHPINNRRILQALRHDFAASEAAVQAWCQRWIGDGFDALEALLQQDTQRGSFCFGGRPGLADAYLIPQVESARRFQVDMTRWPLITAIDAACGQLEAFQKAAPLAQSDAH